MVFDLEKFESRLRVLLNGFADRIVDANPELLKYVGMSSNDAYLLRGYAAFTKCKHGDEVVLSFDIWKGNEQYLITSDVCLDDGRYLSEGPTVTISSNLPNQSDFDAWLDEFEVYLRKSEPILLSATVVI